MQRLSCRRELWLERNIPGRMLLWVQRSREKGYMMFDVEVILQVMVMAIWSKL